METLPPPPPVPAYLQEEQDLPDECRDLLVSLPRERGWISRHMYQYEGFWLPPRHLQGFLACRKHFQARDTDTFLVTIPKSGTTWLKAMAFALITRSKINLDNDEHPLLTTNPQDLVPCLELDLYGAAGKLPDTSPSPRIFATHVPVGSLPRSVKDSSCKIVYLTRDPKDVFVSLWHFVGKLRPDEQGANELEDMFGKFCDGASPYGPFWDHVLGYWSESLENPRKVLFLKYKEIKEQPAGGLRRLAEFLDCPFSPEEEAKGVVDEVTRLCSFDCLSNLEVNKTGSIKAGVPNSAFFRQGKVGGWPEVLTPEMAKRLVKGCIISVFH